MIQEWTRLRDKHVWDEEVVMTWNELRKLRNKQGIDVHMARLFGICVEKGSELKPTDDRRKFKYRVVFQ